jgi:hypothetical protein
VFGLFPLRNPEALGAQHAVKRAHARLELVKRLGGDHLADQAVHRRVLQRHDVARAVFGGFAAEPLAQADAGFEVLPRRVVDQIPVARTAAFDVLRIVDPLELGVDPYLTQVLDVGVHYAVEGRAELQKHGVERLTFGVAQKAVGARRPACLVQQSDGLAQDAAGRQVLGGVVDRGQHGGLGQDRLWQQPFGHQRL